VPLSFSFPRLNQGSDKTEQNRDSNAAADTNLQGKNHRTPPYRKIM
jgi:hypothetical protein